MAIHSQNIFLPLHSDDAPVEVFSFNKKKESLSSKQIVTIKVMAVFMSYISTIPYILPAKEIVADDHPILQNMFALGEVIAWGTLYAGSAFHIIDQLNSYENTPSKRKCCYWITIFAYGIISQLPGAYVIYHYDRSVFWSILTPLAYSCFSIHSLNRSTTRLLRESSFLAKCLKKDLPAFITKRNVISSIKQCSLLLMNSQEEPDSIPPTTNCLDCKFCGIMSNPNRDKAFIFCNIINSIRNCFTKFLVNEIINFYICWFPLWQPCLAIIFIVSYKFFLFSK